MSLAREQEHITTLNDYADKITPLIRVDSSYKERITLA